MAQKNISLNRMAAMSLLVAYSAVLLLLVCMDCFLIGSYQKNRRMEEEQLLNDYADRVGSDMEEINSTFYDVFNNNRYFSALTGTLTEMKQYDNEYELDYSLRNRISLEEWMHGYVAYYNAGRNVRYHMDTTKVGNEDSARIRQMAAEMMQQNVSGWQWVFLETEEHLYGLLFGKKRNASLCMVYNLEQAGQDLPREKGELFYLYGGRILGDTAYGDMQQELAEEPDGSQSSFRGYMDGSYLYARRIENTELWLCMAVPVTLFTYMNIPQLLLVLFTLGTMFGAFWLWRYIARELILPLRELSAVMNRIRGGEWEAVVEHGARFEEIQRINEALGAMMTEIKKQKMLSYEQTIEKQKAQMQYLQLQLKPHFYLNSLKTLNVFAMNGESGKMQDLIMHLSQHLRYLLQSEREMVPLAAEIEYVRNYELLQSDMRGRSFSILWNVQEDLAQWQVPTLCIQTFVENSFKYARLGAAKKELLIEISVGELETEDGTFLDIHIRDNGAGYPDEILEEINDEPVEGGVSVGINNLKRRCRFLYQDWVEYGFYNEEGAVSELILPWK